MNNILRVLVALPALLFAIVGLQYMFDPAGATATLGMSLSEGAGLSSQIADGGGFFLGMAVMMLLGLVKSNATWLRAPAVSLIIAAIYRVLAWQVHGADLVIDSIVIEVVVAAILLFAASKLDH